MRPLFWLSLAVIGYTYAGYPLAMGVLARVRPRGWRRAAWPAGGERPVSIVMAVHNGAALLAAKMEHLLGLDVELVKEIVVVSDGSTDGTNGILAAVRDERVRAIVLAEQVGKAAAANAGVRAATGEIVLFVDIRPWIEPGAVGALLANFADPSVGCVAGELVLRAGQSKGQDGTMAAVSGLYWRYEQWIRNCEAAWDSPVGVYGGFYAVRRRLAVEVPPGTILDDMYQPLAVIRQGYRSVLERSAVVTDTWPAKASGEFSRKVRTLAGNFQLVVLAPWVVGPGNRVAVQLVSHKLLRLAVPYCFVGLLGSSAALGYWGFAGAQAGFWALAAVSVRWKVPGLHKVGGPAGALLVLNAAAVAGLWRFLSTGREELWRMWKPTPVGEG